jgi:serine/threonine-protein kinase HipA
MDKNGVWQLSPAYDLTFSVDLSAPAYANRHLLTINGKNDNILLSDIEKVAVENDISNYKTLIENVLNSIEQFEKLAENLGIGKNLIEKIRNKFNFIKSKSTSIQCEIEDDEQQKLKQ